MSAPTRRRAALVQAAADSSNSPAPPAGASGRPAPSGPNLIHLSEGSTSFTAPSYSGADASGVSEGQNAAPDNTMSAASAIGSGSGSRSNSSTPTLDASNASRAGVRSGAAAGPSGTKPPMGMKFKPKVPLARRVKVEGDVKPVITAASPAPAPSARGGTPSRGRGGASDRGRGGHPDRGRGAASGRGGPGGRGRGRGQPAQSSVGVGVFGSSRPATTSSWSRPTNRAAVAPVSMRAFDDQEQEVYSDDENHGIIDIDQVQHLSESAPTSLWRDRDSHQGKAKLKAKAKAQASERKGKGKATSKSRESQEPRTIVEGGLAVKAEPISPEKRSMPLQARDEREDDEMRSEDESQDRDELGQRIRSRTGTTALLEDEEEVNEAQKVDLSESEDEDEEADMDGDFWVPPGDVTDENDPQNKLFIFQFPHLFPKFNPPGPIDITIKEDPAGPSAAASTAATPATATPANGEAGAEVKPEANGDAKPTVPDEPLKEVKPDIKPTAAQLAAEKKKKANAPPPQGKIGDMVVMKSGKVKMVLGKDIVMDVNPGVATRFLQHLVNIDAPSKQLQVLGEVHRNYVVTPDINRLLADLYVNGGVTPGEVEAKRLRDWKAFVAKKGLGKGEVIE